MKFRLGHSPDSDDAFMFWGLASGQVKTEHEFEHILKDIQTLNDWAMEGRLESSAVSVHAFAYVADKYALLRHGGSFGENYGPMIVARRPMSWEELRETKIAVPGKLTSAFLSLNLYFAERSAGTFLPAATARWECGERPVVASQEPLRQRDGTGPSYEVVPFDDIIPSIQRGDFEAGVIIHEGQLTYEKEGMVLIEDLGKWWKGSTGLPLPLGVNVVRKDLGAKVVSEVSRCMRESISAGLNNRQAALRYALQFARGMDVATSDEFVGMYVNERTLDMGREGIAAIRLFLQKGAEIGLVPPVEIEVAD